MNETEFAKLSAGHALGALSAADEHAFDAARAGRPDRERLVAEDLAAAARLGEVGELTPPARVRDDLLRRIADTPQTAAGVEGPATAPAAADVVRPTARPAHVRRRRRAWYALAAAIVILAAVAIGSTVVPQLLRPPAVVALETIEAAPDAQKATAAVSGGSPATLHWAVSTGKAVLVAERLPAIPADRTFELWYLRDGRPIAAGTFTASTGTTTALLRPGMRPGDVIAVTVEDSGGSASGAPTTQPIVAIPTN
ncbi:anti-sigma factor [Microbacterium capsulatum]|uniref:Anti-sigma factor n=1 Tax=Microbacterium capsulatum TaxID=3041921 RepID=A0ABU0XBS6_9MICO|nr:anti-sigma factor [Microbacterium sp. ASV81]MDQ4212561.1 anti-sigma factor [Microbacterium sp. ASV81]